MSKFKQELPPDGGYRPFVFSRIPAKQYFSGYAMFAGFLGLTTIGMIGHFFDHKRTKIDEIERLDTLIAIEPLLLAERDRIYLKQLRANREEEAELMKNVPGWKVGTYYGEPIYKTLPPNTFMDPIRNEYYAHANKYYLYENMYIDGLY